jgi:hypothetical protein
MAQPAIQLLRAHSSAAATTPAGTVVGYAAAALCSAALVLSTRGAMLGDPPPHDTNLSLSQPAARGQPQAPAQPVPQDARRLGHPRPGEEGRRSNWSEGSAAAAAAVAAAAESQPPGHATHQAAPDRGLGLSLADAANYNQALGDRCPSTGCGA